MRPTADGVLDRSRPPVAGEPTPFHFPPFVRHELTNGLRLLLAPLPRVPLIQIELITPGGAQHDPPDQAGLATLTAALTDDGTQHRSAPEIATEVERFGGHLATGADWDAASISLGTLAENLDSGLELLAEIILAPTFPLPELERVRRQRLADLLRRRDQPAALAEERFAWALYAGTVYGWPLLGTEEGVNAITRETVEDFYRRRMSAGGAVLVAVGDFDPGAFTAAVENRFASWRPAPPTPPPLIAPLPRDGVEIHVVDRPQAVQTELRVGHVGVPRTHPDHIALLLLNSILGGKFTSRINLNLRERHGFTYGAYSRFTQRLGPGPFVVGAAVGNENVGAAVGEIVRELERLQQELVEPAELEDARRYLLGIFPYSLQTIEGVGRRLEELAVFSLPDDYFGRYPGLLDAVDRQEVLAVAQRHLRPRRLVVVAVGPAPVLRSQLEPLGPVRTWPSPEARIGS